MEDIEKEELELRMYFFVPQNVSEIYKGIQAGHALGKYALMYGRMNPEHPVWEFLTNHETWVILNGGTTNDERDINLMVNGTLNQIGDGLNHNNIEFSFFHEPDLNNALTALCFICDARVFDKKNYPDFVDYVIEKTPFVQSQQIIGIRLKRAEDLQEEYNSLYKEWVRLVGGIKNVYLRELLKGKKKA